MEAARLGYEVMNVRTKAYDFEIPLYIFEKLQTETTSVLNQNAILLPTSGSANGQHKCACTAVGQKIIIVGLLKRTTGRLLEATVERIGSKNVWFKS